MSGQRNVYIPTRLLPSRQGGMALLLMMFIIGLASVTFVLRYLEAGRWEHQRQAITLRALNEAKQALMAWAITHSETPGQMPWPDRRETQNPNYDGRSDCSASSFNLINSVGEANFLGQLPALPSTTPCLAYPGVGHVYHDAEDNNLWYAVSRNLVRNYSQSQNPIINPDIINNPSHPWMIVRDGNGNILSNRVAAVIIAPGGPLQGQDRGVAVPPASAFLDQISINGTVYNHAIYDAQPKEFIQTSVRPGFNDRLVYITIDELMHGLEQRVAREVKRAINFPSIYPGLSKLPWMIPLDAVPGPPGYHLQAGQYEFERVGYVPARCASDESCRRFPTRLSWKFNGVVASEPTYPSTAAKRSALQSHLTSNSVSNVEFICERDVDGNALYCSAEVTTTTPKRKLYITLPKDIDTTRTLYDAQASGYAGETLETLETGVIKVADAYDDHEEVLGQISPGGTGHLVMSNINLYPVLPEWYFNNGWYAFVFAAVAPAYAGGGDAVCSADDCLSLQTLQGGVSSRIAQLPALVFTRQPPANFSLVTGNAQGLDFIRPAAINGAVAW